MASSGHLFLLLMSSSLLLSTVTISASDNQDQQEETPKKINKFKAVMKATSKFVLQNIDKFRFAVLPFLGFIPGVGQYISAICTFAMVGVSFSNDNKMLLATVKSEFESLNFKLDEYHTKQKWDTWASGAYHKPEMKIHTAWTIFNTFLNTLPQAKDDDEKKRHTDEFINAYSKYEPATKNLHKLLTTKGTTFISNLGDMLAQHVKCHEKDIREYNVFISKLIYMGNTMNQVYYTLKKITSAARIAEEAQITYESASVMFQIHKYCIINSTDFIQKDVVGLMDNTKDRQKLAEKVRSELAVMYDRYDWMVVAFITKNSKHKIIETQNKHILSGFTEVTKGEVSVAVARQVKGNHTKASKVKKAIDPCFAKSVLCYKVPKTLGACGGFVGRIPVSQTYTAVHAFISEGHDSYNAQEVQKDAKTPYIYTGKCNKSPGIKGGKFVVLIKSDEEMMTTDPCSELDCGGSQKGECVRVENTSLAMCECKLPYYGQNCEQSLEDYKKELEKKTVMVDDNGEVFLQINLE